MFSMDQSTLRICSLMKTDFWIKSVTCDNAPPGGAAYGAIFSLALLVKGFAVVLLFSGPECRGAQSFAGGHSFLGKGWGLPPSGFYGKQGIEGKG